MSMLKASTFPGWHKAPHDATDWGPDTHKYSECWYKQVAGEWYLAKYWCGSRSWVKMEKPPSSYRIRQFVSRRFMRK